MASNNPFEFDKSAKWLLQHHGDSMLWLGGMRDIVSWTPLQAEVVVPRKLPDGLIEVRLKNRADSVLVVVEVSTYPDPRVGEQILRDATLVYADRRVLPEVLLLVLHPRGQVKSGDSRQLESAMGWTKCAVHWRTVNLWEIPAEDLFQRQDPGLLPWIPLAQSTDTPEQILWKCHSAIEIEAVPEERLELHLLLNLLAGLRYNIEGMVQFVGGRAVLQESSFVKWLNAIQLRKSLTIFLKARFGEFPDDVAMTLEKIGDEDFLNELTSHAATCKSLDEFRHQLVK